MMQRHRGSGPLHLRRPVVLGPGGGVRGGLASEFTRKMAGRLRHSLLGATCLSVWPILSHPVECSGKSMALGTSGASSDSASLVSQLCDLGQSFIYLRAQFHPCENRTETLLNSGVL